MAGPARKNSVTEAIMERRLRPIYDYLDSGMNKKAIQEGDRLLKKHSQASPTIQALKAIAYLRLGKKEECLALITPIFDSVPTDDNTIQALTVCYREMNKPEMVCQLLENSIKKDKSEDNLTYCFMSYVRVQDFQKQHQIAMTLYKAHPKAPYFSWAVMSLLVKAIYEPPETADRITLPLAERMMSKFVEQQQQHNTEYELNLYYLILYRLKKYEEAYEVLKNAHTTGILWTPGKYINLMWNCLKHTKKESLMMPFLEDYLSGKSNENCRIDSWKFYKEYVTECTRLNPKRVEDFLTTGLSNATANIDVAGERSILVAMLLFRKTNLHENLGGYVPSISTMDVFKKYIEIFGAKSMFFYDMGSFFSSMIRRKEDFQEILDAFENSCSPTNGTYSVPVVTRRANMAMLRYNFSSSDPVTDAANLLSVSQNYVEDYLIHRKELILSKILTDIRDTQPYDSFLVLASHCLLKSVFNKSVYEKIWEGKQTIIPESDRLSQQMSNVNSTEESIKYVLTDDDVPLLLSMTFLEFGLEERPYCSPLRIMLGKAYMIGGAALAGAEQFHRLDLKHAQIESLGYLYFWKMLRSGLLTDCFRLLSTARHFYGGHIKESMEHVLSGYKYGAWDKVLEFMDFRKSVFSSLQSPLLKVEESLLEFTKEANSHDVSLFIAQKDNFEVRSSIIDEMHTLQPNWDFNTMQNYERERVSEKEIELLVEEERDKLRIRTCISGLINSFLMLTTEVKDEHRFDQLANYIDSLLDIYIKSINRSFEEYSFVQVHLDGPWSPTLWKYKKSGCPDILKKAFQLLLSAAKDPSSPKTIEKMKSFEDDMNVFGDPEMKCLQFSRITPLLKIGEIIESMYSIVETFGFLAILADVLKCILLKDFAPSGKSKKKKNKEAEMACSGPYDSLLHAILRRIKVFEEIALKYQFKTGTYYPEDWEVMKSSFKNLVSEKLYNSVLPVGWPKVAENLNISYKGSFTEMLLTLELKQKYIESQLITAVSSIS